MRKQIGNLFFMTAFLYASSIAADTVLLCINLPLTNTVCNPLLPLTKDVTPVNPSTLPPSYLKLTGTRAFAVSLPYTAYTASRADPLPGVVKRTEPSFISFMDISGTITASFSIRPVMYIPSVESFLRNLYLAGRFLNRFLTSTVVPVQTGLS